MTRIGNWGQQQLYLARIADVQDRIHTGETQVATKKKTTSYSKLTTAEVTQSISFENQLNVANTYLQNNAIATTKLKAASSSIDGIRKTLTQFRDALRSFSDGNPADETKVKQIQDFAFRAMQDLQASLNTNVNGQFIFAGGRIDTAPVELSANTLGEFQSRFDGANTVYPTSRALHMADWRLSETTTGDLTFDPNNGLLIPENPRAYKDVPVGSFVSVSGTTSNDANYTIRSHAATNSSGAALVETTNPAVDPGSNAFITYSGSALANAATGDLQFAFNSDGAMVVTPTTAGSLSALTAGTKFTIAGSNAGSYDGAYVVAGYNANTGAVTLANDLDMGLTETVDSALLTFGAHTDADGVADTTVGPAAFAGDAAVSLSGNRVTLTLPTGATDLTATFAVGDLVTLGGTASHNGTFKVAAVTNNPDTISFDINPEALRVSQFVPQSGRSDVAISFKDLATGRQADIDAASTMMYDPVTGTTAAASNSGYGTLTFSPNGTGGEVITASNVGGFVDLDGNNYPPQGTILTFTSPTGVNDGVYEVVSNNGTDIVVRGRPLVTETAVTSSMATESWYKGDNITINHRAAADRNLELGVYGSDPAFEKALRALSNIAQGAYGTSGGLENHAERVTESLNLIQDAIERQGKSAVGGTETVGDLNSLQADIGFMTNMFKEIDTNHKWTVSHSQTRLEEIQGVDMSEAITKLLADQSALEAAYQTIATVRRTSLLDFLK